MSVRCDSPQPIWAHGIQITAHKVASLGYESYGSRVRSPRTTSAGTLSVPGYESGSPVSSSVFSPLSTRIQPGPATLAAVLRRALELIVDDG